MKYAGMRFQFLLLIVIFKLSCLPVFGQQPSIATPAEPELIVSMGHAEEFETIVSNDSRIIVTYSKNEIRIWNRELEKVIRIIDGKGIESVDFDASCSKLLVLGRDGLHLYAIRTGEALPQVFFHDGLRTARYSSLKNFILTTGSDSTVKIWSASSGELTATLRHQEGWTNSYEDGRIDIAQFNETTGRILTTTDTITYLWDSKTYEVVARFNTVNSLKGQALENFKKLPSEPKYESRNYRGYQTLSPDGSLLAIVSSHGPICLYDGRTGRYLRELKESAAIQSGPVEFSSNSKYFLTRHGQHWNKVRAWSTLSGKKTFDDGSIPCPDYESFGCDTVMMSVKAAHFSPFGNTVIVTGLQYPNTELDESHWYWYVRLLRADNGRILDSVYNECDLGLVFKTEPLYSRDGKYLFVSFGDQSFQSNSGVNIYNKDLNKIGALRGGNFSLTDVTLSKSGNRLLVSTDEEFPPSVYSTTSGELLSSLADPSVGRWRWPVAGHHFTTDETKVLSFYDFGDPILWNSDSGSLIRSFTTTKVRNTRFAVSRWKTKYPDFIFLHSKYGGENQRSMVDVLHGKITEFDRGFSAFSESGSYFANFDGRTVTVSASDSFVEKKRMDLTALLEKYGLLYKMEQSPEDIRYKISSEGRLASISLYSRGIIVDIERDTLLKAFIDHKLVEFSQDENFFLMAGSTGMRLYSVANCRNPKWSIEFSTLLGSVLTSSPDVFISPDNSSILLVKESSCWLLDFETGALKKKFLVEGKFKEVHWQKGWILSTYDAQLIITDINMGTTLLTKTFLSENDWLVTHPSGLFDATPSAMRQLYFVQGMDVIQVDQLKDRFYEPGLWKKIADGAELRKTTGFRSIELPPEIETADIDDKGYLRIKLRNRGGGIGQVNVYINGKEVFDDARAKSTDSKAEVLDLRLYIGNHKNLVKGTENSIAVKAWNEGHWVVSRSSIIPFYTQSLEKYKPTAHILTIGVSDYTGNALDLKYAAKDAEDFGRAMQLASRELFGIDHSIVYTLTTSRSKEFYPTKNNIVETLKKIAENSHPLDVFLMYISGHGLNHGGQDGDWYYLTQDAYTADAAAYNDPDIRKQTSLSSRELVELIKQSPVLKQVLIIDACASGKVVDNLKDEKDISSNTIRALDRMRDRTGMHIITGSAADAVSYEASKYGQGVLTYSLLEGMRGAALRENKFVDVNRLFQYAMDRVPILAQGIGGIQSPQVFSPQGSQSFDIGILSDAQKSAIPIASIRPVYIRSTFIDIERKRDVLQLSKLVDELLNDNSAKGVESKLIFVDVAEYPEACQLSGTYRQEGGTIKLELLTVCEGKDELKNISGASVQEIVQQIINAVIK